MVVLVAVSSYLGYRQFATWQATQIEEESEVLLEKIRTVCKLVTVEGYFSEVYDYKDYWGYDFSPFRKKALIRVRATVSAGYDLGDLKVDMFPDRKLVVLSGFPDPEILAIDHEIDYYDITEGTFNSFSAADYTRLTQKAKAYIATRAEESALLESAEQQGDQILDLIELMVSSAGWELDAPTRSLAN